MSDVPSSPEDKKKLKMAITEITNCLLRIDSEREAMKEIIEQVSEDYEIDKKIIRKISSTLHKRNYENLIQEHETFENLYESLIEGRTGI